MTPMPDHIAREVANLEPAAQTVVRMLWYFHEEQMGELRALREQLAERDAKLAERDAKLEELQARYDKLRGTVFGRSSEKLPPIQSEVRRAVEEDELDLDLPADASEYEVAHATTTARRKMGRKTSESARKKKRKSLKDLPVITEVVHVKAEQLPSGMTLDRFRPLGQGEVVRRIEHVREHLVIVEYQLEKLVEKGGELIISAASPPNVIDGGAWGASVYARIIVQKCIDSMPLYRQEKAWGRNGFAIARSVMCDLFHRAAEVLKPIYDRLIALVVAHPYVQADETKLRIAEPNKARDAWIWALLCEDIVAFAFSESRSAETANLLLGQTTGHLVVDGYAGYNGVIGEDGRTRVGCWAHLRRYFYQALSTAPEARELVDLIVQLYRVEHDAAMNDLLGTPAHGLLREEASAPIVAAIEAWIDARQGITAPKSPLGQALTYAKNQRHSMRVFLSDPKLPLDNNASERALCIIARGRKNFLFVGHEQAGHNLAILQSICATCQIHGVDPYDYLRDVLVRVRHHPHHRLDDLLPMNWQPPPD
jgi:transposase